MRTETEIVDEMETVRRRNNVNWMDILRLALRHAPAETRALIRDIRSCDAQVVALFRELEG